MRTSKNIALQVQIMWEDLSVRTKQGSSWAAATAPGVDGTDTAAKAQPHTHYTKGEMNWLVSESGLVQLKVEEIEWRTRVCLEFLDCRLGPPLQVQSP